MASFSDYREAVRKQSEKQSKEMQKKRESRPGPVREGGVSLAQRFKNWLNEDRLPAYMRQPGQDEYGRSKKEKAAAAAAEFKKNPPSQKSAKYSQNDIRMQKITPSRPVPKAAPTVSKPSASAPPPVVKKQEVVMGTAPADKSVSPTPAPKAAPKAAPKPAPKAAAKPRNYSRDTADMLGGSDKGALSEDNAVMKKLRERAAMSAAERGKPLSSDNQYADRFKKFGFAKGGHVKADGCAKKGKTRGRII